VSYFLTKKPDFLLPEPEEFLFFRRNTGTSVASETVQSVAVVGFPGISQSPTPVAVEVIVAVQQPGISSEPQSSTVQTTTSIQPSVQNVQTEPPTVPVVGSIGLPGYEVGVASLTLVGVCGVSAGSISALIGIESVSLQAQIGYGQIQIGALLSVIEVAFTITGPTVLASKPVRAYLSSTFTSALPRVWNGTAFISSRMKIWNGLEHVG
jgi:hypothetical protein